MAVTLAIPIGMTVTLQPNVVYALPGMSTTLYTDSAAPALEQSNVIDFATKSVVTLTGGSAKVSAAFIRATSGSPIVRLTKE
jgi:hypothetical protein